MSDSTGSHILGQFRLHEVVGRGGMGEVWRGEHIEQGVPVAVKVLTGDMALSSDFQDAFFDEARAVARLSHPNVIHLFDFGFVSEQAELDSEGLLTAGTPFLVMEYAPNGTLVDLYREGLTWWQIREIALRMLDALAHSHARGLFHLDIKPANVLAGWPTSEQLFEGVEFGLDEKIDGLRLADFGIALSQGDAVTDSLTLDSDAPTGMHGTPSYMAPEQILGEYHNVGPWTDLYALGCLIWLLVTGRPPFLSQKESSFLGHLHLPPPPLTPWLSVPGDLSKWLRTLLEKDPRRRFQRAADAAEALRNLSSELVPPGLASEPAREATMEASSASRSDPTLHLNRDSTMESEGERTQQLIDDTGTIPFGPADDGDSFDTIQISHTTGITRVSGTLDLRGQVERPKACEPPESWRGGERDPDSTKLIGTGLNLFEVRRLPIIGRDEQKEQLWQLLSEVRNSGSARVAFIEAEEGVGASSLAAWMLERCHETGAATTMYATHHGEAKLDAPLKRMIRNFTRSTHLSGERLLDHLKSTLSDGSENQLSDVASICDWLEGEQGGDSGDYNFALLTRVLERHSLERPCVVWLAAPQDGTLSVSFVDYVLQFQKVTPSRVLFLISSQVGTTNKGLDQIREEEATTSILLEPLPRDSHAEFVSRLIGLHPHLAERVVEGTGGNTMFTRQLVGHWVQAGELAASPRGFVLVEENSLPENLRQLWGVRLNAFIAANPKRLDPVVYAGLLGRVVETEELSMLADSEAVREMADGLFLCGLATGKAARWTFASDALVDEACALATVEHHRALLEILKERLPLDSPARPQRLLRAAIRAEDQESIVEVWREAFAKRAVIGLFGETSGDVLACGEQLRELGFEESHPIWGCVGWAHTNALFREQDRKGAGAVCEGYIEQARRHGWMERLPSLLRHRGVMLQGFVESKARRDYILAARKSALQRTSMR